MPRIKQRVNIRSHCKAICNSIFAVIFERFDMCSFKHFWHGNICNNAPLASSKNIVTEFGLVGATDSEILNSFALHFRCNFACANLLQNHLQRGISNRGCKNFSNLRFDKSIDVILFSISRHAVNLFQISVIFEEQQIFSGNAEIISTLATIRPVSNGNLAGTIPKNKIHIVLNLCMAAGKRYNNLRQLCGG